LVKDRQGDKPGAESDLAAARQLMPDIEQATTAWRKKWGL
jgi:hypothetical protein